MKLNIIMSFQKFVSCRDVKQVVSNWHDLIFSGFLLVNMLGRHDLVENHVVLTHASQIGSLT